MNFFDKLNAAIARNQSLLYAGLDPNPETLPVSYGTPQSSLMGQSCLIVPDEDSSLIERLRDWLQFLIAQTADLVCAYKPTLGFYAALGAQGLELLQHTLAAIPDSIPIILDAKHADLNSSSVFAETIFEKWNVDAVTLSPYPGQDLAAPFLLYPDKTVFLLCHTSNPAALPLQEYPSPDSPFYLQIVKEVQTWGTPEQVGLEVGVAMPEALARVRAIAPERLILGRSVWTEGSDLATILAAGLNASGEGLIIPVPSDLLSHEQPKPEIKVLREAVNQARNRIARENISCPVWFPNVCSLDKPPHLDLILQLYDLGCIMFGDYVQASGATFPYYVDLRKIISNPQIFEKIIAAYAEILKDLTFDRIAGIPYGALPTATGLALRMNYPMIFPRKEVKAHGTRRVVEGHFAPGETVVVVDDILISGKSVMEGASKLKQTGLKIEDIVVFIDHEKGVKDRLRDNGYRGHSVLTISEIAKTLYECDRIEPEQFEAFTATH